MIGTSEADTDVGVVDTQAGPWPIGYRTFDVP